MTASVGVLAAVGTGIFFMHSQQSLTRTLAVVNRELSVEKHAAAVREGALKAQLIRRTEAAPSRSVAPEMRDLTSFTDGLYTAGLDVVPGTYATTTATASCYWEVDSDAQRSDMLHNGFGSRGLITIHVSQGQEFQTQACGQWNLQK